MEEKGSAKQTIIPNEFWEEWKHVYIYSSVNEGERGRELYVDGLNHFALSIIKVYRDQYASFILNVC